AQRVPEVLLGAGVAQRAQVLEVRPGREVLAGAGEEDGPHPLLAPRPAVDRGDLIRHGRRQGVGAVGIVERHPQEVALPPRLNPLVHPLSRHPRASISPSGTSISIWSSPWAWVLPWASFFRLSVPPPPSESWRMKLRARRFGSS